MPQTGLRPVSPNSRAPRHSRESGNLLGAMELCKDLMRGRDWFDEPPLAMSARLCYDVHATAFDVARALYEAPRIIEPMREGRCALLLVRVWVRNAVASAFTSWSQEGSACPARSWPLASP